MLNPDLYPCISQRKSIRKYKDDPLTEEQTGKVQNVLANAVPLFPEEKYSLEFSPEKQRIYAYCENTIVGNANLGFVLQQVDLALFLEGLGRLWFGMGREPKDTKKAPPLSYAICLKVGIAAEPVARQSTEEFKRKPIEEVIAGADLWPAFETARLAPSARNVQPWRFVREGAAIHAFRKKPGAIGAALIGRMNQCDMGIALCHAILGLEYEGYVITEISHDTSVSAPAGYEYTATIRI
jgi:hypothetical protein